MKEIAAALVGSARAGMTTNKASGWRPWTMPVAYVANPALAFAAAVLLPDFMNMTNYGFNLNQANPWLKVNKLFNQPATSRLG